MGICRFHFIWVNHIVSRRNPRQATEVVALEQPKYELVLKSGELELRNYESFWIAECFISNAQHLNTASSYAFSRLFGYIQGRNSKSMPIQMTKPVRQEPHEDGWKIS